VDEGIVEFFTMVLLSTRTAAGPSMGIPIMRSLYRKPLIISVATRNATNSDPNVDVSTVFCDFEYQIIGALLRYKRIPVCD
jgi:hypothetical protein